MTQQDVAFILYALLPKKVMGHGILTEDDTRLFRRFRRRIYLKGQRKQIFEITGNVQELLQSRHTAPQKEPRLGPHLPSGADWSSPLQVTAAGSRPSGLQLPALERGFRRESLTDSWCCILSLRSCFATVTESNTASAATHSRSPWGPSTVWQQGLVQAVWRFRGLSGAADSIRLLHHSVHPDCTGLLPFELCLHWERASEVWWGVTV
ncbi:uncharacterized protein LOC127043868 isoform X2 [Gopherus flavomarginatus]|uniref:uncharacterized protein LOC127043868 isoform X2 n=1 Tax=Gopherus flavomarginatus TaxID=286002 RepID=UPI0021CC1B5A|nr:uncharacterized protein LOC127043868 isoform X2 [Gopherus flavomarginatus]